MSQCFKVCGETGVAHKSPQLTVTLYKYQISIPNGRQCECIVIVESLMMSR